jgi:Sedlin, N-terminal conserved region
VVVEDEALPEIQKNVDDEIRRLLVNVHSLYVADLMNPFKKIGSPIVSNRFKEGIQVSVAAFNQTDGL